MSHNMSTKPQNKCIIAVMARPLHDKMLKEGWQEGLADCITF